ncbi:tetraacyldisaccharide 4'-kinase [Dyadobacter luticola]|uniref:Tetraacyldisaccharide 4'-kinase n=1 Tax=Dyadobacter luticola TaxID=1979387 RepID=A0A5R9KTV4_9BACT|nr:tetraacyldisaccharide 4'-kinase [Dyadobacter luticola]TLU99508.1 tetraacyldisaccharide 4'-kinase [Dyadobacter luticola]
MHEHRLIKILLLPLSWLYGSITGIRNFLYDQRIFSSRKVPQFVISVGNLTVGGTGKTPVIEYLANLLLPVSSVAILSRGYGRKTAGYVLANDASTAEMIGDEPLQFYSKFRNKALVAVCEKRVTGALNIYQSNTGIKTLLLDDAYQHRAIARNVNLLLNDYNRPFYQDIPLPAGRLREWRSGAKRADAVIVTKCPENLSDNDQQQIRANIEEYTKPGTPVFFCFTDYAAPVGFDNRPIQLKNVKMVAGIANPGPFAAYLRSHFNVVDEVVFPDHHNYTGADLEELIKYLKSDTFAVTTEKDMVKLKPLAEQAGCADRFAYIPVTINFETQTEAFTKWLTGQMTEPFNPAER